MSLPRSIDRSDLSGATVTLTTNTETVVLVGPLLQTPKDTSIVVTLATITLTMGSAATGIILRVRQGSTVTGAQVGQNYTLGGLAGPQGAVIPIIATQAASFTDYVQHCITATQVGATGNGTVFAAALLSISF